VEQFADKSAADLSSCGQFRLYLKNHLAYLEFEKSQRSVTHDSLRYVNILTYLLTYLLTRSNGIFFMDHSM